MSDQVAFPVSIPDEKSLPKQEKQPAWRPKVNNLAGDKDLVREFQAFAKTNLEHYRSQQAYQEWRKTGGKLDIIDRMWRVALRKDTTNDQHQNTLSNVSSTMIYKQIRAITSGQTALFFNKDELPAKYEPEINTTEFTADEGEFIARQQNMLQAYTFDEDKRRDKIKESLLWNVTYGNEIVGIWWDRRVSERIERVPDQAKGKDENGRWKAFKFEKRKRVTKDCPSMFRWDIKNAYFDHSIDDFDAQRCILLEGQETYENLLSQHLSGEFKNFGNINRSATWVADDDETPLNDRLTNADEGSQENWNGLFKIWHVWAWVPIREYEKRKGKGKWEPGNTVPKLYWATFIGRITDGCSTCVRLVSNPFFHGKHGLKMIHSIRDNKGAMHDCIATRLESLYYQATTNINQAFDNVTMINQAPWTVNGPIHTKDLKFRANKLIRLGRQTQLTQLDVENATGITLAMNDRIEQDANDTSGANKPIMAEPLGSRTSATEAKNVFDQAVLPLEEQALYVADQLFPWMYEIDAELWRQYGDPDLILQFTHNNQIQRVMPSQLWGPMKTKVIAVSRFRNNTVRRQEINSFVQGAYGMAREEMSPEGRKRFWRDAWRIFGLEHGDEIFPVQGDYDAESRAIAETSTMLIQGEFVNADQAENHNAHIAVHEPAAAQYKFLPDKNEDNLRLILEHIQIHKDFRAQQRQQAAQAGAGTDQTQEGLPGEISANAIEAQEGALANV